MHVTLRLFLPAAIALSSLLCPGASRLSAMTAVGARNQVGEEDLTVYGALIEYLYERQFLDKGRKLLVIYDQTSRGVYFDGNMKKTLQYVKKEIPALSPELLEIYRTRNMKEYALGGRLPVKSDYLFVTRIDIDNIFRDKGWSGFYLRYPEAGGILGFSRVAYNKPGTEALVFASCSKGGTNFFTSFYRLVKADGLWKVEGEVIMAAG
jgi:hypothetical protein